jgi:hypothetical protein
MATLDQFLAAIRQQESGGNYKVVNSIGALGAYQVMTSNLPSWSQAALGHSVSVSEFLGHPEEQDAVARYELGPVFNTHGAAGAAAWWYSGQTDPTKTYGNPPVYKYVQEVLARIGSAGSVTGGSTNATPADDISGATVQQAGLQQAGYQAALNLTPWGIPLNPFKLPGWLAGKLGGAAESGGSALVGGLVDSVGPVLLAGLGVATGAALLVLGVYVTVKPTVDKAQDKVEQALPLAAAAL